eukprot:TRINITY_DN6313_c0_g1_i1.p1 TRINITY_DN6313_c0_g1~~TRINITY_DN6313_c0_g1_i1.p1  ORF type:complete len:306 (-),score=51.62 TRINITY_DN6313_c0_g1_i1:174-1091(-)
MRIVEIVVVLFVLCVCGSQAASFIRPTVLWHGMGDTCCYPFSMGAIKNLIEKNLPDIYVYSIEVGNSIEDDEYNSYFMNVNDQIEYVCAKLANVSALQYGFNAIGFSQGGQFLRAYVERCNSPKVYNLISVGGQHQGIFGIPSCIGVNRTLCELMRKMLNQGAYEDFVQYHSVQSEYWQDPLKYEEYLAKNIFLPDINNNLDKKNATYKNNLLSLNHFALVKFLNDTVVVPRESEWFGFYQIGQDKVVVAVENTTLYTEDWIGLKTLNENKQVSFIATIGNHLEFTDAWFEQNIIPFLNNTITTA